MPNNSSEQSRKLLYNEYEDSLFRLVMYDVAEKEGRLLLDENEQLQKDPEYLPSQEKTKIFNKRLDISFKRRVSFISRRQMAKVFNKVAAVMLTLIIVFSTALITVQAFRMEVLNFLIKVESQYTTLQLKDNSNSSESKSLVVNWTNSYVPTYVPDGYQLASITDTNGIKRLTFSNEEGLSIKYRECSASNSIAVDSENASLFENVEINGQNGVLVVKNDTVTVAWETNNRMFVIQTNTTTDEAIKIANGVKFIK